MFAFTFQHECQMRLRSPKQSSKCLDQSTGHLWHSKTHWSGSLEVDCSFMHSRHILYWQRSCQPGHSWLFTISVTSHKNNLYTHTHIQVWKKALNNQLYVFQLSTWDSLTHFLDHIWAIWHMRQRQGISILSCLLLAWVSPPGPILCSWGPSQWFACLFWPPSVSLPQWDLLGKWAGSGRHIPAIVLDNVFLECLMGIWCLPNLTSQPAAKAH